MLVYEQPLHDLMRLMLRLEQMFDQLASTLEHDAPKASIHALLGIRDLLSRSDFKTKLLRKQTDLIKYFNTLEDNPSVDEQEVEAVVQSLKRYFALLDAKSQIGSELAEHPFFEQLYKHIATPGGPCIISMPIYRYWLNRPHQTRIEDIQAIISSIHYIKEITDFMLYLTRASGDFKTASFDQGIFEKSLMPGKTPIELIRVGFEENVDYIPEFSVDPRRLVIRLMSPDQFYQLSSTHHDQSFQIAICSI